MKEIKFRIICIGALSLIIVFIIFVILTSKKTSLNDMSDETTMLQSTEEQINEVSLNIEDNTENIETAENIDRLPTITISEQYITNTGEGTCMYYIDEQKILWGAGENQYGQLGIGTQDYEYYSEFVQIAEDVIHVDYSESGFTIFLTTDGKLYGMGNGGTGALLQSTDVEGVPYINGEQYVVTSPVLLLEDVSYASCGRDDIVAIKNFGVYVWGIIWDQGGGNMEYVSKPTKVLDDALLVTGGMYNHAALLKDGSVWTWGYNYTGNCGVEGKNVISTPEKVAEDVMMVWTNIFSYNLDSAGSEANQDDNRRMENTIIQKSDGSYWICGINIGTEEKTIPYYYEVAEFTVICSSEFYKYEGMFDEKIEF
ncbi:MAG: hypothetical protein ACK5MV_12800 [Aminipila sp.]